MMNYKAYVDYSHDQLDHFQNGLKVDYAPEMFDYIKLNNHRSDRIYKSLPIAEELMMAVKNIRNTQKWVLITEPWCGDAAHSVPIIGKLAELNPVISLEIYLRDRNPELMDQYLTEGSRSIPLLVIRNEAGNDLEKWGPRPKGAQALVKALKLRPEVSKKEAMEQVQVWYARNKYFDIQSELHKLFEKFN